MSLHLSHFLLLLLIISAATTLISAATSPPDDGVSLNLWCVAKNNADDSALQSAIDWACGTGGADCTPIQQNGPCYDSNDIRKTASFAFNDYCTKNGMTQDTCNFANTAALTSLDPSHSGCKFPSSMEGGKTTEGTTATVGGGASTADLTSNGINVAYGGCLWLWCLFLFFPFWWCQNELIWHT